MPQTGARPPTAGVSADAQPSGEAPQQPMLQPPADSGDEPSTYSRYRDYVERYPEVLDAAVALARQWVARHRRCGAKLIVEMLRWNTPLGGPEVDGYKINNSYAPYLARDIIARAPELADAITTRSSAADRFHQIVRWPGGGPRLDRGPGSPT